MAPVAAALCHTLQVPDGTRGTDLFYAVRKSPDAVAPLPVTKFAARSQCHFAQAKRPETRNRADGRADGAVASDVRRRAPFQYRRLHMAFFHTSPCSSPAFSLVTPRRRVALVPVAGSWGNATSFQFQFEVLSEQVTS